MMKVIVNAPDAMPAPGALNWRPEGLARFESLWSMLHKLQYLNHASAMTLFKVIGHEKYRSKPQVTDDLWGFDKIDGPRLAVLLGISESTLVLSVVEPYRLPFESPVHICAAADLRYCPACIEKGFHTPLFQLHAMERCPIHNRLLEEQCPRCHKTIPYKFSHATLANPYGCACGHVFWAERDAWEWEPGISPAEERLIDNYLRWTARIMTDDDWVLRELPIIRSWERVDPLIGGYWHDLRPIPGWPAECFRRDAQEIRGQATCGIPLPSTPRVSMDDGCARTGTEDAPREKDAAARQLARTFLPTYKSIRRNLHKLLRDHHACIRIARTSRRLSCEIHGDASCPWGNAFVQWRLVWERSDFRFSLGHSRGWVRFFDMVVNFSIDDIARILQIKPDAAGPPPLFEWVIQRLLAQCLIGSFYECLQLIIDPDGEYVPEPRGRSSPYFLWIPASNGRPDTIFWWSRSVLRDLDRTAAANARHRQAVQRAQAEQLDAERNMINSLRQRNRHGSSS